MVYTKTLLPHNFSVVYRVKLFEFKRGILKRSKQLDGFWAPHLPNFYILYFTVLYIEISRLLRRRDLKQTCLLFVQKYLQQPEKRVFAKSTLKKHRAHLLARAVRRDVRASRRWLGCARLRTVLASSTISSSFSRTKAPVSGWSSSLTTMPSRNHCQN